MFILRCLGDCVLWCFFFFSSRRRHTRLQGDWSSDVCSSDLALAGAGRVNLFTLVLLCVLAAICADFIWYTLGRFKGIKIIQFICKISLQPDSCVRRTEGAFSKQGARSLLVAKFVPGLNTVAPPLAGIFLMRVPRFLFFDACGALLWSCAYLGVGYAFSNEIERIAEYGPRLGRGLVVLLVGALVSYIAYKFIARQRFLRELRIGRISADELKRKIDAGEDLVIVDLRHSLDFEANPETIPGAFRMDVKELEERNERLPRDRDVILFCT